MQQNTANSFAFPNPLGSFLHPPGASHASSLTDRRHRPRVLLELPVRVRWLGPFGLETEVTQSCNASRDGLLVSSALPRQPGSLLWATFPYDAAVEFTESETRGKVTRCKSVLSSNNVIAVSFLQDDPASRDDAATPDNSAGRAARNDRRGHARIPLAYLVRVARRRATCDTSELPLESPFRTEETMTVDVSPDGMIFCTLRIYSCDEHLLIAAQAGRKLSGERHARVVRVSRPQPESPLSCVAVKFLS
jgi:hypothetical protein